MSKVFAVYRLEGSGFTQRASSGKGVVALRCEVPKLPYLVLRWAPFVNLLWANARTDACKDIRKFVKVIPIQS